MVFPGLNKQVDAVLYDSNGNPVVVGSGGQVAASILSSTSLADGGGISAYLANVLGQGAVTGVNPLYFNGVSYDRVRGNVESTILSSASRTTTQTGSDRTNYNGSGLILFVSITSAGTGSITPSLQIKDSVSSDYKTIWTAAAALIANGDAVYIFYPGEATLGAFTEALQMHPSRTYRWIITANNANPVTYSVGEVVLI